jgi:acetyl esterase/lipase
MKRESCKWGWFWPAVMLLLVAAAVWFCTSLSLDDSGIGVAGEAPAPGGHPGELASESPSGRATLRRPAETPTNDDADPATTPSPEKETIRYGPHARQELDFWRPSGETAAPLVLYFHGGGFRSGDKSRLGAPLRNALLGAGLAVAAVNYRLTDEASFPDPMTDGARAVQFLRANARRLGIEPDRLGATGHSAGAGIALWLALHDDLALPESGDPLLRESSRLAAVAVFDGQTTYDPRLLQQWFGPTLNPPAALLRLLGLASAADMNDPRYFPRFEEASPLHHASADDPPVLLLYRQSDLTLPADPADPRNVHHPLFGRILREKLAPLGVECRVATLADFDGAHDAMRRAAVDFLARHLARSDY